MKAYKNIQEYINNFEGEQKEKLLEVWNFFKENIKPNKSRELSECINYGIPTFKVNGKNFIHFAGFKNHFGIYPGALAVENFKSDLQKFKTSKGAIQIPYTAPLPKTLLKKIIKFNCEII